MTAESEGNRMWSQGLSAPAPLRGLALPVADSHQEGGQDSGDRREEDRVFGQNPGSTASDRGNIGQQANPSLPTRRQSPAPAVRLRIKPGGFSG